MNRLIVLLPLFSIFLITLHADSTPFPVVDHKKYYFVRSQIILDASKSIARQNKKIKSYIWEQSRKNPAKICDCLLKNKPQVKFGLIKPGTYTFFLTVDDGIESSPYQIKFDAICKYTLDSDLTSDNNIMEYKGNQIYQKIVYPKVTKKYKFQLMIDDKLKVDSMHLFLQKGQYYLIIFNKDTEEFSYEKKNYSTNQTN